MAPERVRNPYRIRKPTRDVLHKAAVGFVNAKGEPVAGTFGATGVRVTPLYCWLGPELTIPIPAIKYVELIPRHKALCIAYYNVLEKREDVVYLVVRSFWGPASHERAVELRELLLKLKEQAPSIEEFFLPRDEAEAQVKVGCERCGDAAAAMVELGYFLCIGLWPLVGAYSWAPKKRYLCETHARRACLWYCFLTSLVGYWGFPGVFVAPVRVWRNAKALREAFPSSAAFAATMLFYGTVVPLLVVGLVLYLILRG